MHTISTNEWKMWSICCVLSNNNSAECIKTNYHDMFLVMNLNNISAKLMTNTYRNATDDNGLSYWSGLLELKWMQ